MQDKYAGIDSRYHAGPGVGCKFLAGPKHFLAGEMGLNYTGEQYTDNMDKDYVGGRAFGQYEYGLTEKSRFSQSVEFLYDLDDTENYNVNSETALISVLNRYLSLKASCLVKYDNQPVPKSLEKTDTILGIALVVNI